MKVKQSDLIWRNRIFVWLAVGTLMILSVPYLLITFRVPLCDPGSGFEVINWTLFDFIVMGFLIFGFAGLFVLVARKIKNKSHQIALAIAFLLGFFWLWAELAVGVFTNWGS